MEGHCRFVLTPNARRRGLWLVSTYMPSIQKGKQVKWPPKAGVLVLGSGLSLFFRIVPLPSGWLAGTPHFLY